MYVNDFASILGNSVAENNLLSYSQSNGIETLLLYELHIVNANYNLSNPTTNSILADFISKAKTMYGIVNVGATSENGNSFTNVIDAYNNSRNDANEKFDIYNLEFEFWNPNSTDPGEYYCTTYLTPNGLPCTNDGAFQFFMSTLQTMRNLASNNSHPITVEAYVGWPTQAQAVTIGANLDRVLLHAYVSDPNTAFSYAENRIIDFANGNPGLDVSIIFSSEPEFMQNWLTNNDITTSENIFTQDWLTGSSGWVNNINLIGFTYFAYTFNIDATLSTNSQQPPYKPVKICPNPVENILVVQNVDQLKNIKVYNSIGQLIFETKEAKVDFTMQPKGIYLLRIYTDKGVEAKKIIKQ